MTNTTNTALSTDLFNAFASAQDAAIDAVRRGEFSDTVSEMNLKLEGNGVIHTLPGLVGYGWAFKLVEEFDAAIKLAESRGYTAWCF